MPAWDAVAREFANNSSIIIGSVDCDDAESSELCNETATNLPPHWLPSGFPRIAYYLLPDPNPEQYENLQTADVMIEHIRYVHNRCVISQFDNCSFDDRREFRIATEFVRLREMKKTFAHISHGMERANLLLQKTQKELKEIDRPEKRTHWVRNRTETIAQHSEALRAMVRKHRQRHLLYKQRIKEMEDAGVVETDYAPKDDRLFSNPIKQLPVMPGSPKAEMAEAEFLAADQERREQAAEKFKKQLGDKVNEQLKKHTKEQGKEQRKKKKKRKTKRKKPKGKDEL